MLRALTAELADPGRFSRAKAYARDDAVTDIQIEPGSVRAVVQGTRREPYVATVQVRPLEADTREDAEAGVAPAAQLLPSREDLAVACTCPDGEGWGAVCKHALAALLVLADEVSIEPQLLLRWRSGSAAGWAGPAPLARAGRASGATDAPAGARRSAVAVDVLADRLRAPAPRPDEPVVAPGPRVPVTDGFSETLVSALDDLRSSAGASG